MLEFDPEGRFFTDFEVDDTPFGSGAFGRVYKCKHKLDLQIYAIKVLKISEKTKLKKLREAQFLASMEDSHIVRYYQAWIEYGHVLLDSEEEEDVESKEEDEIDSKEEEEEIDSEEEEEYAGVGTEESLLFSEPVEKKLVCLLFIQMELCHGTLSDKLKKPPLDNVELAWEWFLQIMEGLNHLHMFGIVHNDLSTKNIFIDKNNHAKIGDLGLAKELRSTISKRSLGAKLYCAPEKKKGVEIDSKMDIFSAGVILYELLNPFSTVSERIKYLEKIEKGNMVEVLKIREGKPPVEGHWGIEQLVINMVSQCPSERPSASEVLALLPALKVEFIHCFSSSSEHG